MLDLWIKYFSVKTIGLVQRSQLNGLIATLPGSIKIVKVHVYNDFRQYLPYLALLNIPYKSVVKSSVHEHLEETKIQLQFNRKNAMTFFSFSPHINLKSLSRCYLCHERCTHPLLHMDGGQYEVKRGFGCIGSGILYRSSDIMEHEAVMRQQSVRYTTTSSKQ